MHVALTEQIKAHAQRAEPLEACGFVFWRAGALVAEPARNTAPDPWHEFRIDPEDHLRAIQTGQLRGYYHTHPKTDEMPSNRDIAIAEHVALPCYVFSLVTGRLHVHTPTTAR